MQPHKIVFLRHGHRDTNVRDIDNGLDEKGWRQVQDLKEQFIQGALPHGEVYYSSPKKRCRETIEPLAKLAGKNMIVAQKLNEREDAESEKQFLKRIHFFIEELLSNADNYKCIYLCSHGDVLPMMIDALTGQWREVKKGRAVIANRKAQTWILE